MSLPGSPPLLTPGSGAPTSVALYRSAPDALHGSSGASSPHPHPHSHPHPLSPSPRLTSSMLSAFLPGPGGALAGLGNGGGGGLTPGSPGLAQTPPGAGLCSECKLVEVHGVKVASFGADGQELICLPQVFDLFLKHLVGGLHTVYTKLKRLDISPVVCTVEQVRVLRGLGAIQPGVNRCKLISRRDFETLYQDCTSASSRPGRPPKRCPGAGLQESPRLLHPGLPGLLSPNLLSHTGLIMSADADVALTNAAAPNKKTTKDKEESPLGQTLPPGFPAPFLFADGLSSVETLLTNIQGLLKVAVENARTQDKQIQAEKRELKMELYREREMRESLERQLTSELQSRGSSEHQHRQVKHT
ncbi:hypothetical protein F2P81_018110 [Scophthalmus maximus]|uniref:SKI/SNO/DAC domain-containing protein n=1 Tax=Scophthalmus maximus TaxID=52904 RepID=A0A6A4S9I1_SCOMX|nr:hypothetical protein F2P81_018110 [Scophthalmus maximus]